MRKPPTRVQRNHAAQPEMGAELAAQIMAHTPSEGENSTAVSGLSLFRMVSPSVCYLTSVEPGVSFFAQGKKRITIGGGDYLCDAGSFLVASVDLPIQSQIVEASQAAPQLAMRLLFDMQSVRDVVSREDLPEVQRSGERRGLAVGRTTPGLLSAGVRLIQLLDGTRGYPIPQTPDRARTHLPDPADTAGRAASRHRHRRKSEPENGQGHCVVERELRQAPADEDLAEIARMGVSTLHHQFRALAGMSPLQFQKQLRLRVARERMLRDSLDATSAAYEVGYESVSQFNREYSRFFGQPPMRDIKAIRDGKVVAIDAA